MTSPDRAKHLEWCKQRALYLLDHEQFMRAVASMIYDLAERPDTRLDDVPTVTEGIKLAMENDIEGLRDWINDFV